MANINFLDFSDIKHIHFIGIGGISMSGLAEILVNLGYKVSGSDIKESSITKKLKAMGLEINIGHSAENIKNPDLVVYTAAIRDDNTELRKARELNIPAIERATLLGQIMNRYPYSIAVSGTHGKTTTTSMITMIMIEAGMNPTVHIGGELTAIGGTTKIGSNTYFIAEACEYCGSFLKFYPYIAIILNIEFDHADYFKDIQHIKNSFLEFAQHVPDNGYVVACANDDNVLSILDELKCNILTYGLKTEKAMWSAKDIEFDDLGHPTFTLTRNGEPITMVKLNIPGIHNVNNALAAIAACQAVGCSMDSIRRGIEKFLGTHRRFELKGVINNIKVIDDYAHHPSEVKATLKAAKNICHSKIWCVFQPHTYTRTKSFLNDFALSFTNADTVILADIYAAREVSRGDIHSSMLAEKIKDCGKNALYIPEFESIVKYLQSNASPGDLIITMGAGDIYKVGEMFIEGGRVMAVG
ncbi:MAG: UDP-N-acetylmuramate--L-alanine ligase [Acetivibrionales bacterium]